MCDSDDDDYELPSLSERVQAFHKPKAISEVYLTSDSDCDEKEFLKFSETVRNTASSTRLCCSFTSDSESEDSQGLKGEPNEVFLPKMQSLQINGTADSDSDSDSDESDFLTFSERVRSTPRCDSKVLHGKANHPKPGVINTNSIRKLQKSHLINKENYGEANTSDSDDSFFTPRRVLKTPKSLISTGHKRSSPPTVLQEQNTFPEGGTGNRGRLSVPQLDNEKEFLALFPPNAVDSSFSKDRSACAAKLYEFFNRKIFNSELPGDMRLAWDGSLRVTAGLTCCSRKGGVYSCYIRLSSKLLTSFGRMRDTLLHEMCHAAVWMIGKRNEHHGPLWKIWASRCQLILPFVDLPQRCHEYEVDYKVWYQCPLCNKRIGRCKQVRSLQNSVCKKCKVPLVVRTKE